ncbi:unnamed protein product [Durusdinium trenchii]|uniref:Uncharacterized protein n=1 Tax=Durusdinium trenchii TaxID=1381693 RepID=A0ABP0LVI5_9DINO
MLRVTTQEPSETDEASNNALALTRRGEVKRLQGDHAGALRDLHDALKLEPNHAVEAVALKMLQVLPLETRWLNFTKPGSLDVWQACPMIELKRWAIIGAGPVGLALVSALAESFANSGYSTDEYSIHLYESRWIQRRQGESKWKRREGFPARGQVVTLQDSVVNLFSERVRLCFEGERVWSSSRNVPISEIEDKLLANIQDENFGGSHYVAIHRYRTHSELQTHASWIEGLDADIVVGADGGASMTRRAFKGAFVSPQASGANVEEERIRLGEADSQLVGQDYALGIALREDRQPPQRQALNVIFTLAQNMYLRNSKGGSQGFLNIRLTKEEYDEIFRATNKQGCAFGSPIDLVGSDDYVTDEVVPTRARTQVRNLPWLRRRIDEGLKLFNMRPQNQDIITGFLLAPAYVQCFYHALPQATHRKVLLLAGDAAISHHFWPGRGLNTGLKSAFALVKMFSMPLVAQGVKQYNTFMERLREREMQGRSAPMMRKDMQLHWQDTLLPREPTFFQRLMGQGGSVERAQQFANMAQRDYETNLANFVDNCKKWRTFLEGQSGWPHDEVTDDELNILTTASRRPRPLELQLMLSSAFTSYEEGRQPAAGWPTSLQRGREVDPGEDTYWN